MATKGSKVQDSEVQRFRGSEVQSSEFKGSAQPPAKKCPVKSKKTS
jgi:hypothetical protein